jgi:hypothetical protein
MCRLATAATDGWKIDTRRISGTHLRVQVWYPRHFGLVFASVVAFYVLLYIAGGRRLPWKIKFRGLPAYVLISVRIVGFVLLLALYEAHKTR